MDGLSQGQTGNFSLQKFINSFIILLFMLTMLEIKWGLIYFYISLFFGLYMG